MSEVALLAMQRAKMSLISGTRLWCHPILEASDKRLFPSTSCGQPVRVHAEMFETIK
jgi:hypothetical protein